LCTANTGESIVGFVWIIALSLLSWRDSLYGAMIYIIGDSVAAVLTNEFQISRMIGMMLLGGTIYAIEIPHYFAWIDRYLDNKGYWNRIKRALLAEAFFNPLWIARHIALIKCFSGQYADLQWNLLSIGWTSFIQIAPFAIVINYFIQNLIPLAWRFMASAVFSALMAVYYALSEVLFV
jgi:hypothetical protein